MKQVRYPPREAIDAYKEHGLEFQTLYMLDVEHAHFPRIPDDATFLTADDGSFYLGRFP